MISHFSISVDAVLEHDLLRAVNDAVDNGVKYVLGSDGYMAFDIEAKADIKTPYKMIMPEKLYEFAIMATIRTNKTSGYLFSVVNPLDTIVQLGLRINTVPPQNTKLNITLIYADPNADVSIAKQSELATFQIPYS